MMPEVLVEAGCKKKGQMGPKILMLSSGSRRAGGLRNDASESSHISAQVYGTDLVCPTISKCSTKGPRCVLKVSIGKGMLSNCLNRALRGSSAWPP